MIGEAEVLIGEEADLPLAAEEDIEVRREVKIPKLAAEDFQEGILAEEEDNFGLSSLGYRLA